MYFTIHYFMLLLYHTLYYAFTISYIYLTISSSIINHHIIHQVLKKPKFDLIKLMEMHGDQAEDTGAAALDKVAAANTVKALKGAGGRL